LKTKGCLLFQISMKITYFPHKYVQYVTFKKLSTNYKKLYRYSNSFVFYCSCKKHVAFGQ
jgi:hypothetical protein